MGMILSFSLVMELLILHLGPCPDLEAQWPLAKACAIKPVWRGL